MVQPAARTGSPQLVVLGFRTYSNFCWARISAGTGSLLLHFVYAEHFQPSCVLLGGMPDQVCPFDMPRW